MAKKHTVWAVAALGLALASGAGWWVQRNGVPGMGVAAPGGGGSPGGAQAGPGGPGGPGGGARAPGVEVTKVKVGRLQDDAQAVGTLKSRQSVMLRPEVAGRVARIAFADGARVKQGQLLVQLDDVLQQAEVSQAQAQVSIARANLTRNRELVAEKFVAPRVVDESQAALQVAEAQLALAQARLARMRIVAPFEGSLGIRQVSLGDYVKDGADLVNLEDTRSLYVDYRLPERYQGKVATGQTVLVELDGVPGAKFWAKVVALDALVDANGRSLAVRALLPQQVAPSGGPSGSALRPGMFARTTTVFGVNEAALMVPEEAIVPQGGKQFVQTVVPEGDARKLVSKRVEVTLGVRQAATVQVVTGLNADDTVVVAGQQRLQKDGTAVKVVDMSAKGGPGKGGDGAGPGAKPRETPENAAKKPMNSSVEGVKDSKNESTAPPVAPTKP